MKVHVIGLGETAKDFKPDGCITIGVNDVPNCDYQVCVDRPNAFSDERRKKILELKPELFYTHLQEWSLFFNCAYINLKNVHAHGQRWNHFIPSSNNSPFVACGVAYKFLDAKEIRLWGVDFNTHHLLSKDNFFETAVADFKELQRITRMKIIPAVGSRLHGKI